MKFTWSYSNIVYYVLQDFVFPEEVAFPIGGDDKVHTHFVLEMRYDNPNFIPGYVKHVVFNAQTHAQLCG